MASAPRPRWNRARPALGASLVLGVAACSTSTRVVAPPVPPARVDEARLAADVAWLASDAREGRRAGNAGERAAADWIARRMAELDLEPAGAGGYLQPFEVRLEPEDRGRTWIARAPGGERGDGTRFTGPRSVEPLFCSIGGSARGRLDLRGYGIRDETLGWDDYAEGDCAGAIVLVVDGVPALPAVPAEAANRGGARRGWTLHDKVVTAKRRGAVGVVVAQHPRDAARGLRDFHDGPTAVGTLPAVTVSSEVAERLAPGFGAYIAAVDARAQAAGERLAERPESPGEVAFSVDVHRGDGTAYNVLGVVPGVDRSRTVVLGAHFDHLGLGGSGSTASGGEVHNGADDNASGTAVVLEVARLLVGAEAPPPCDVLVAAWSAGERDQAGSRHWLASDARGGRRVLCALNVDSVGRVGDGAVRVAGVASAEAFAGALEVAAAGAGVAPLRAAPDARASDDASFLAERIPALSFGGERRPEQRGPADDARLFEPGGAARVVDLVRDLVERLGARGELPFALELEPRPERASGG